MKTPLLILALCLSVWADTHALTNKVLIIGIDGTMPSALAVARTPNLDALKANGCYSERVVSHPVTHSAAAWSSLFTGVWGDKHGVNDPGNSFAGNQFADYPSFYARLEAANRNLNTLAFARWAPMLTAVPDADVKRSFVNDSSVTDETCRQLTNANPDVLWMLLLDVDSAGHASGWGPTATNYVRAIEIADMRVGQIMGALTNRITYPQENWLVIVTTDHGEHDHPDPERSRITWVITSGQSAARGVIWPAPAIVDICATVLTHMQVPINPAWNLDARVAGLPRLPARLGTNLIFNGDAEGNSGTNDHTPDRGVAWWFDLANTSIGVYGANSNFPSLTTPGPLNRGANLFIAGTNSSMLQRIDISNLRAEVDGPGLDYELSGWFGGAARQTEVVTLTAWFLSSNAVLGSNIVGSNMGAGAGRENARDLLLRTTNGALPSGTRYVEWVLTSRVVSGSDVSEATAENLSFVLTSRPEPAFQITAHGPTTNGWRIEFNSLADRLYVLERSATLQEWTPVTPAVAGNGQAMTLVDTNPPVAQAFYRLARPPPPPSPPWPRRSLGEGGRGRGRGRSRPTELPYPAI